MPTPVSDGEKVYVWVGTGVAACFDLEGNKQWMTRIYPGELTYGSSPAIADGVLVTFLNRLYGFDMKTGEQLWEQPKVRLNVASLIAGKLSGEQVIVTQRGDVIREINRQRVRTMADWDRLVKDAKPGDRLTGKNRRRARVFHSRGVFRIGKESKLAGTGLFHSADSADLGVISVQNAVEAQGDLGEFHGRLLDKFHTCSRVNANDIRSGIYRGIRESR